MRNGTELLFIAAMVMQSIRIYKTGGPPLLPKGYTFIQTFGTPLNQKLGFMAASSKHIVLAFRGTENPKDVLYDLDLTQIPYPYAGAGMTHRGFTLLYEQLRDPLWYAWSRLRKGRKLYIGGHSLGGALATLAALDLAANDDKTRQTVATFGSPRVGNALFAATYDALIPHSIRVVNENDLIPLYPPEALGYRHVRQELPIRFYGGTGHAMSGYYDTLSRMFPASRSRYRNGKTDGSFIDFS